MAYTGDHYTGLYCPFCGKGLKEAYQGIQRLAECIRGHRWQTGAEGRAITMRSIETAKEKPSSPTMFGEQGYY